MIQRSGLCVVEHVYGQLIGILEGCHGLRYLAWYARCSSIPVEQRISNALRVTKGVGVIGYGIPEIANVAIALCLQGWRVQRTRIQRVHKCHYLVLRKYPVLLHQRLPVGQWIGRRRRLYERQDQIIVSSHRAGSDAAAREIAVEYLRRTRIIDRSKGLVDDHCLSYLTGKNDTSYADWQRIRRQHADWPVHGLCPKILTGLEGQIVVAVHQISAHCISDVAYVSGTGAGDWITILCFHVGNNLCLYERYVGTQQRGCVDKAKPCWILQIPATAHGVTKLRAGIVQYHSTGRCEYVIKLVYVHEVIDERLIQGHTVGWITSYRGAAHSYHVGRAAFYAAL